MRSHRAALSNVLSGFRNFKRLLCLPTKLEEVNISQNTVQGFGWNSVSSLGSTWGCIDLFLGFWKILHSDSISVMDRNWELGYGAVKCPVTKFNPSHQNLHVCSQSPSYFHPPHLFNAWKADVESWGFLSLAGHLVHHQWITPLPGAHNNLIYAAWQPHLRLITWGSHRNVWTIWNNGFFLRVQVWKWKNNNH